MNTKLTIITLVGFIVGMVLMSPTFFLGDILIGGFVVGLLAWVIGYFVLSKKEEENKVEN